jgi:hypothetical protein
MKQTDFSKTQHSTVTITNDSEADEISFNLKNVYKNDQRN